MALTVEKLKREFEFKNSNGKVIKLTDPSPQMRAEEVVKFYSGTYPELTTATISGPKLEDNRQIFTIKTQAGTKG